MALAMVFASCTKEEDPDDNKDQGIVVKKEQWALAINYTATWCGACGSSGAPVIKTVGAMNRVLAITPHSGNGDPMHNQTYYSQFTAERTSGGSIPSFWVNDEKTTTSSTNSAVVTALTLQPTAALGMEATKNGTVYNVKVKTKWFSEGAGEYYLSVFLLEDNIDGSATAPAAYKQNGTSDASYKHMFVFRAVATTSLYGEMIATNPAAQHTIEKEYAINILPDWQNKVYPVAILWKYDTSTAKPHYKFVNAIK